MENANGPQKVQDQKIPPTPPAPNRTSPDISQHYDIDGVSLTKEGVKVSSDGNSLPNEDETDEAAIDID